MRSAHGKQMYTFEQRCDLYVQRAKDICEIEREERLNRIDIYLDLRKQRSIKNYAQRFTQQENRMLNQLKEEK